MISKRMRGACNEDVETALLKWFTTVREENVPVSGLLLREKADSLAKKLGNDTFKCRNGRMDRFKSRHGLIFRNVCGEAASVDEIVVSRWLKDTLPSMLTSYSSADIFNADETGPFYRLLPDKTMSFKKGSCQEGKKSKERLTVLVGANMDGTEKLPLLVIGKSESPRCFKSVRTAPADYKFNRKAWMTPEIFKEWLSKLDVRFKREGRRVLMIVDNRPAHPKVENLGNICLAFLPPNCTSCLQPCTWE